MAQPSTFKPANLPTYWKWAILALLLLLGLGLGLRLFDLTDQPIDFHPTRQLRSAIIARGMYYRMLPDMDPALRQQAIAAWNSTGQYEPSILEYLVAQTYRMVGGEYPWVARIINTLFWLIGGLALFDLARRGASTSAALVSLGYYLILPFAVQASRSFQPDPGMVMWMILSVNFFYRWSDAVQRLTNNVERSTWTWAILAGICGGIAVFTKFVAAYILAPVAVTMVLYALWNKGGGSSSEPTAFRNKLQRFLRQPQAWGQVLVMAALMTVPTLIFYLGRQGRASEYFQDWTISLSHLLIEPSFYVRWLSLVQNLMGLSALLLGLVGVLVATPRYRALLISLWGGYILYGMFLPYQMYTHSYYHLQLVPIIALSLAPLAQLILTRLGQEKPIWKFLFAGIVVIGMLYPAWVSIATFRSVDYRSEPERWQQIAALLPKDGNIVALTQDYGYPLIYYGQRKVALWPNRGERTLSSLRGSSKDFEEYFAKRTQGKSYFLITAFNQFDDQPDLKNYLAEHFPVVAEGNGYLIYDLETPLPVQGGP
jgi:hypothetical protein